MPDRDIDTGEWDAIAGWWIAEHADGADREYAEQVIPEATAGMGTPRRILEIGSGEGQVARHLARLGHQVVGLEPSLELVSHAAARRGGPTFARGRAERLPFATAAFDAVVACLVFEHVEALDSSLAEVRRVLRPGGRFRWVLNHPIVQTPDSGWVEDHTSDPPDAYWRLGPYLAESSTVETITSGVGVRFVHRPVSRLIGAALRSGLFLTDVREPPPLEPFAAEYPRLMCLTFGEPGAGAAGTVTTDG